MTDNTGTGDAGNTGGTGDNPGGNTGGGNTPPPWYDGIDAENLGYLQGRGLTAKTAQEALVATIQAHKNAEAYIGVPADRVLRLPADPVKETEAMDAIYRRLGKPAEPKDYNFAEVKFADGTELDQEFTDFARGLAHKLNLPPDAAQHLVAEFVKRGEAEDAQEAALAAARTQTEVDALKAKWGPQYDANLFIARNAAQKLGISAEVVDRLAAVDGVGMAAVLDMFRDLGVRLGEDSLVAGNPHVNNGVMTKEQAIAKWYELSSDAAWVERLSAGNELAVKERDALFQFFNFADLQAAKKARWANRPAVA